MGSNGLISLKPSLVLVALTAHSLKENTGVEVFIVLLSDCIVGGVVAMTCL